MDTILIHIPIHTPNRVLFYFRQVVTGRLSLGVVQIADGRLEVGG